MEQFVSAVKTVYASGMSVDSLRYRSAHGLLGQDEQMSILVQRVSGMAHGRWFFPQDAVERREPRRELWSAVRHDVSRSMWRRGMYHFRAAWRGAQKTQPSSRGGPLEKRKKARNVPAQGGW